MREIRPLNQGPRKSFPPKPDGQTEIRTDILIQSSFTTKNNYLEYEYDFLVKDDTVAHLSNLCLTIAINRTTCLPLKKIQPLWKEGGYKDGLFLTKICLFLVRLGQVKFRLDLPGGLGEELGWVMKGYSPPQGLEIGKIVTLLMFEKLRKGVLCA